MLRTLELGRDSWYADTESDQHWNDRMASCKSISERGHQLLQCEQEHTNVNIDDCQILLPGGRRELWCRSWLELDCTAIEEHQPNNQDHIGPTGTIRSRGQRRGTQCLPHAWRGDQTRNRCLSDRI